MGISVWQILIVLVIVILLFGTKKLRTLGGDLGEAVKGFKNGIQTDDDVGDDVKPIESASIENKSAANTKENPTVVPEFSQQSSSSL